MELILKSNDKNSIAKIITLAKKLNVIVEQQDVIDNEDEDIEVIKQRILAFRTNTPSSIKDPVEWQREQRKDSDLPFSK